MVSLKNRSKGFTIIELLIVIVVIAILATLVIVTFTGIQQKGRNSQRQTDVNAVAQHVEAYYADHGYYPTLANLQDPDWVADNLKGLDAAALLDPKGTATDTNTGVSDTLSTTSYSYVTNPADCDNAADNECAGFTLTAQLEGGDGTDTYSKKSNT